jgi:NADH:ubiquinone oxidoreductase subunit B-like Fe-S oxidoreductase
MRVDEKAGTEQFIFTELNNLLNNIFSNTASTLMWKFPTKCCYHIMVHLTYKDIVPN